MADILLVGEDRERAKGIRSLLREDGHAVTWLSAVREWRDAERDVLPDLVIAPVRAADPVLSAPGRPVRGFPPPLLFVQSESDFYREFHAEERLIDRIESPFGAEEFLARVDALVRVRRVVLRGGRARRRAGGVSAESGTSGRIRWRDLGSRLASLLASRVPRHAKPSAPYLEVAARAADWADLRDGFEPGHTERVTSFSAMIADGLDLPDGEAAALLRAAMLHDVGKVALPVEILKQQGPLDEEQLRLMRTHPERGAALVRVLDPDEAVVQAILCHHERTDGRGYYGKRAEEIPRAAHVLAVAETFDAMTTSRVRLTLSHDAALAVLREQRGGQLEADCVDAFVDAMKPRRISVPVSPVLP